MTSHHQKKANELQKNWRFNLISDSIPQKKLQHQPFFEASGLDSFWVQNLNVAFDTRNMHWCVWIIIYLYIVSKIVGYMKQCMCIYVYIYTDSSLLVILIYTFILLIPHFCWVDPLFLISSISSSCDGLIEVPHPRWIIQIVGNHSEGVQKQCRSLVEVHELLTDLLLGWGLVVPPSFCEMFNGQNKI